MMPPERTGVMELKTKSIYTLAREKTVDLSEKFFCEFKEEVQKNNSYSMNCYYFGCIYQINGNCPFLKGDKVK